jgi:predicted MFS family arabinose efflux permease
VRTEEHTLESVVMQGIVASTFPRNPVPLLLFFLQTVFDFSRPHFRAMNSNLVVEMIDGGFTLGSLIAGAILRFQSYMFLFFILAVVNGACLFLTVPLAGKKKP